MTSKRLLIISIVVMIKQERFRSVEQIQSHHEIIDIKIQFRNETADNDFEKRKINVFQKFKKKQTFL